MNEDIEYIGNQIQRSVSMHKYCCICCEKQDSTLVAKKSEVKKEFILRKVTVVVKNIFKKVDYFFTKNYRLRVR